MCVRSGDHFQKERIADQEINGSRPEHIDEVFCCFNRLFFAIRVVDRRVRFSCCRCLVGLSEFDAVPLVSISDLGCGVGSSNVFLGGVSPTEAAYIGFVFFFWGGKQKVPHVSGLHHIAFPQIIVNVHTSTEAKQLRRRDR